MESNVFIVTSLLALFLIPAASAADPDIEAFYAIPNNPVEDSHFEIYVRAEDAEGIDKIKLYVDGRFEDSEYCDGDDRCSVYFDIYEASPGYHSYLVKVYDEDDEREEEDLRVYVSPKSTCGNGFCDGAESCSSCPRDCGPCNYCGNGVCNAGESCSTCPSDCGVCNYCGNGICNVGESCSNCPQDCGACDYCGDLSCDFGENCGNCPVDCGSCVPVPVERYSCRERGGECCERGGQGVIDGASDCPNSCFSVCNEDTDPADSGATGAIVAGGASAVLLGLLVIITLLLGYVAARN